MYKPKPIDISKVNLNDELYELVETLSENVHDIWARQRLSEGWKYGPSRNDNRKENPDIVKYDELPESEKEYDRILVLNTIKAIIALGYKIEKE